MLTGNFDLSLLGTADRILFPNSAKLWLWELEKENHASPDLYAAIPYHHTPQLDVVWGFDLCRDKEGFGQAVIEDMSSYAFFLVTIYHRER